MKRKRLVAGIASLSLASLAALGIAASSPAQAAGTFANLQSSRQNCSGGYLNITVDDGPSTQTPKLLTALDRNNLRVTFFDIGQNVQKYPLYATAEVASGDLVENHTWDHTDLTTLTPAAQSAEFSKTSQIIRKWTGRTPTLARPPYGATNDDVRAVEANNGLGEMLWSSNGDTNDWDGTSVAEIAATVSDVAPGGTVLLHDLPGTNTVAAIPSIVKALQARNMCAGKPTPTKTPVNVWENLSFFYGSTAW